MRAAMFPRRVLLVVGLAFSAPTVTDAQDVSVRAYLSPGSTVGVGRPFVLNVEITGTQSLSEQPDLPDLAEFAQFLGSSSSSSMQVVNGRTSVSLTMQYRYQALEEGTFEIPSFDVAAGGRVHVTEPLELTVTATPPPSSAGPGDQAGAAAVGAEDLFVTAEATKARVLEGEPFIVEYRIWTQVDVGSFTFTRLPEPEGFWVEDITPSGQPRVEQRTRNGQQYTTAVVRRLALVPTGPGERTLEPVGLEVQVRVRRRSDPFDIFGRSSLFGSTVVPTSVLSEPFTIEVVPLPSAPPEPFSGVVGSLSLSAGLDRDSVDANEAVTLTVRAAGDGNIRGVPDPDLGLPSDFEVFPPEVSESIRPSGSGLSGEKTFEYVVIPRAPGRRRIGPVAMSYFDPEAGAYRMVESESLELTVTGVAVDGPGERTRAGVTQLREDIRFIHLDSSSLRPMGGSLFAGAAFWIFALLPVMAIVGAVALRRHRDMLEGDAAYARGRRASRVAKKRLAEARRLAEGEDFRGCHAEVARALRGFVADRLNLAEAGLQSAELERRLREAGVAEDTVREVVAILEHCDRQRFAPSVADREEKARFLDGVGDLMKTLDRTLAR